jgi:2-C-methyl-D-erythritol 4-phosphate cytidylyltransferase
MYTSVIIPAAGFGERMGSAIGKQFLVLNGEPIIVHTLRQFQRADFIDEIIVVTREESFAMLDQLIANGGLTKVRPLVKGGRTRQDSVCNGLSAVNERCDIVLVHDAVRPFIAREVIAQAAEAAAVSGAAIVAVRAKDTMKLAGPDGRVEKTLDRAFLWNVQTPQAFRLSILRDAYALAASRNTAATDDSSLVEQLGIAPVIIEGSYDNIKITTPEDLLVAELLAPRFS